MSEEVEAIDVPDPPTPDFANDGAKVATDAAADGETAADAVDVDSASGGLAAADTAASTMSKADAAGGLVPDTAADTVTDVAADPVADTADKVIADTVVVAEAEAGDATADVAADAAADAVASAGDTVAEDSAVGATADPEEPDASMSAADAGATADAEPPDADASAADADAVVEQAGGNEGAVPAVGEVEIGSGDAAIDVDDADDGDEKADDIGAEESDKAASGAAGAAGAGEARGDDGGGVSQVSPDADKQKVEDEVRGSEEFAAAGGAVANSQAADEEMVEDDTLTEFLSTTGTPQEHDRAKGTVVLVRTADPDVRTLPPEIVLGPGLQDAVTLGRHSDNEAVLSIKACSKVHCQFALRSFRLPGDPTIHQALFLRDVSKNRTLVNRKLAFQPWHWLQDGDLVGLYANGADGTGVLDFYQVGYRSHVKLPGDAGRKAAAAAAAGGQAPAAAGGGRGKPKGQGRGRGRGGAKEAAGTDALALDARAVGRVIDIHYKDENPPGSFRVRIVGFDKKRNWHKVNSEGLSVWDGEAFEDEVDLRQMHKEGHVVFVDETDGNRKKSKRRRM